AVPVAGILFVLATGIYFHLKGQPWLPEAQRKPSRSLLLGTLGNMKLRRAIEPGDSGLGRLTGSLRRRPPDQVVPKRLANVEQVRDAILRDKLQQRQVEQDEEDAALRAQDAFPRLEAEAGPPIPNETWTGAESASSHRPAQELPVGAGSERGE
ncbi:MAG TPA: hypothetical protein VNL71_13515, partial [Chloroflexota bacterium]|nr:hypothetical protein [Chloroflexota bacterium]